MTLSKAITLAYSGISPDLIPKLFAKYEQLNQTTSEYKGTGLGLSIAQAIVQQHGGEIGVESAIGQGSVFYFTLPI